MLNLYRPIFNSQKIEFDITEIFIAISMIVAKFIKSLLFYKKIHIFFITVYTQLVDLWLGKGKASLRGQVTSHTRQMCECVITQLLYEQVLVEDYHFTPYSTITYILPGPKQHLVKTDRLDVYLSVVSVRILFC